MDSDRKTLTCFNNQWPVASGTQCK